MKSTFRKKFLFLLCTLCTLYFPSSALTDFFTTTSWQYWNGSSWVATQLSPGNYCGQQNPVPGASLIWGPNSNNGQPVRFRLNFTIPASECNLCNRVDSVYSFADDSCAVYINGVNIPLSLGSGGVGLVPQGLIQCGNNVIEIDAADVWGACYWLSAKLRIGASSGSSLSSSSALRSLQVGTCDSCEKLTVGGGLVLDRYGVNNGNLSSSLKFGACNSGEGIASQRTGSSNANGLDFFTASNKRMSITNGGKVGVGTANPDMQFTVRTMFTGDDGVNISNQGTNGNATLALTTASNQWLLKSIGNFYSGGGYKNFGLYDQMSTSYKLVVTPIDGFVGIGVNAPNHKLHVHGGAAMISGSNPQGGPMLLFSDDVTSGAYPNGRWGIEYESSQLGLNFWQPWNPSTGGGSNYRLFLHNNGKVGVGTSAPSTQLHIVASGGNEPLRIESLSSATDTMLVTTDAQGVFHKRSVNSIMSSNSNTCTTPGVIPKVLANTGTLGCSQISDNGTNVGINSSTPSVKFELKCGVNNAIPGNPYYGNNGMQIINTSGVTGASLFLHSESANGTKWGITSTGTANGSGQGKLVFTNFSSGQDFVTLTPTGNLGIGNASPTSRLHVNGDILLQDRGQKVTFLNNAVYIERPVGTDGLMLYGSDIYIKSTLTPIQMMSASTIQMSNISGTTTLLVNPQTGHVGIGTTTPNAPLEVTASGNQSGLRFTNLTSNSSPEPSNGKTLSVNGNGDVILTDASANGSNYWTHNNVQHWLYPNDVNEKVILGVPASDIGIKCASNFSLFVNGGIQTDKLVVKSYGTWPDYVFQPNYQRLTLDQLADYISVNKHLPGIPPALEVDQNGIDIAGMQTRQMEKIEELTLYILELKKELDALRQQLPVTPKTHH